MIARDEEPAGYYHCLSRVVDRQFRFGEVEREQFCGLLRELAAFCKVRVLTYCVMSNHFHLLLEVPRRPETPPTAEEILDDLRKLSGHQDVGAHRQRLEALRESGEGEASWVERIQARRWNLSVFMQLLKQRFSCWYNRRVGRKGTLWEERYRSVLVEGTGRALLTMAAYIDLNPLRAGMVVDPKDYRWSGYGEAIGRGGDAAQGLARLLSLTLGDAALEGGDTLHVYRRWLFCEGSEDREGVQENGQPTRGCFRREDVIRVLQQKGRIGLAEYLRCRIRYFCDGALLGSQEWVEKRFQDYREWFGVNRRSGARRMRGLKEPELYTIRDLRLAVFG